MRSPAKALHLSKMNAEGTKPAGEGGARGTVALRRHAEGGRPHHGWRTAPFGDGTVTLGQEALAFSASADCAGATEGAGSALTAGAGAGLAAS